MNLAITEKLIDNTDFMPKCYTCLGNLPPVTTSTARVAAPVGDYKQRPRILQHCPKAATMGTLLEANQAPEHRRNNRIDNPPTTTGTQILQSILSTSSKLQLHPVPMLGENPERETPTPRMQNLPEREGSSWNHSRNNPTLPPLHVEGNHNAPGLHQVNKSSHTTVASTERKSRRER